jgi:hypothetical protein
MFKNIEISEINKGYVLSTLWNEFAAICVLAYIVILAFLLNDVSNGESISILNTVFLSLFVLAYFLYITFFYLASFFLTAWVLERFLITKPAGESRVYILFLIELVIGVAVLLLTRNHALLSDYWQWMMGVFVLAKAVRLFVLKRKNKLLNHVKPIDN